MQLNVPPDLETLIRSAFPAAVIPTPKMCCVVHHISRIDGIAGAMKALGKTLEIRAV